MIWIALVVGILIGIIFNQILIKTVFKPKPCGSLRIDQSDPDGPYIFLELNRGIKELYDKNEVVLRLNFDDYISQK